MILLVLAGLMHAVSCWVSWGLTDLRGTQLGLLGPAHTVSHPPSSQLSLFTGRWHALGQEKVSRLLEPELRTALSGKLLPLSSGGQSRSQGQSWFTGGEIDTRSWGRRFRVTLQRAQVQEVWDFIICSGIVYEQKTAFLEPSPKFFLVHRRKVEGLAHLVPEYLKHKGEMDHSVS